MSSTPRNENVAHPMRLIGQVSRTFARLVDAPMREFGFAIGQLPVLVTLKNVGALSQVELARIAQVEQPSMAQLLKRMERDGLVQRVPDPTDRRSQLISLTEASSLQLPNAKKAMDAVCDQALAGLTHEDQQHLLDLLLKIDANLAQALDQLLANKKV